MYYYVYQIYNEDMDLSYIGSTSTPIEYRFQQHRHPNNKCRSKELLMVPGHKVEYNILYEGKTDDRELIYQIEKLFIQKLKCVNKNVPLRTHAEYKADLGDEYYIRQRAYNKKYRDENREKISAYQKQYMQDHAEQIREYQREYQKSYRKKQKLMNL